MVRRVVSLVRSAPVALRREDPVLEANAYALAEAVDLTVVLAGPAIQLALAAPAGEHAPTAADDDDDLLQPPASREDLRALLESGVRVYADAGDLRRFGIRADDLVDGVEPLDVNGLARLLAAAQSVLSW